MGFNSGFKGLILYFHIRLGSPKLSFSFSCTYQKLVCNSLLPHTCSSLILHAVFVHFSDLEENIAFRGELILVLILINTIGSGGYSGNRYSIMWTRNVISFTDTTQNDNPSLTCYGSV